MTKITCLDLFSGAGGLSEGFLESGYYRFLGHVEWEKPMVDTLRNNLEKRWGYTSQRARESVVHFDVQKIEELIHGNWSDESKNLFAASNSEVIVNNGLDGIIGDSKVDVIIGGPPCQAYSLAGRAQDPNSMKDDYRNFLFESFVKIVDYYKPKVFVFENVPGILSACPGDTLVINRICDAFNEIGYEIRPPKDLHKAVYDAADFQVPQNRKRVIIFGVRKDSGYTVEDFYKSLDRQKSKEPYKTVRDAIGEMPRFRELDKAYKKGNANVSHELIGDTVIPLHNARYHNKRDIDAFKEWISKNMNYSSNEEKLSFYKKISGKESNHNKYRNLEWNKPAPTIVSHLQKDGLMFIHPDIDQARSITIKEAALLQSFPMDYEFIGSNAYCYKMIGNAVPVLFAKSIAKAVSNVLGE